MKQFDIDKIVQYLAPYRERLNKLYSWNANLEKLIDMQVLSVELIKKLNAFSPYDKELQLKSIVRAAMLKSHTDDSPLFEQLSQWIIKDWGGIRTAKDESTSQLIQEFLKNKDAKFHRIASVSKIASYM